MRARTILPAIVLLVIQAPLPAADDAPRASVVWINVVRRPVELTRPWKRRGAESTGGTGMVIAGKRILTNAHVVRDAVQLYVQPDRSSDKLSGTVEAIAPAVDLAVVRLDDDDEAFFDDHKPLEFSRDVAKVNDGTVNDTPVRNLRHMVELLRDAAGEFVEITFVGTAPDRLVFRRAEVLRDTESILANHDIRQQASPELMRVWPAANKN
jgi:S1-C subfamily serine protease